MAYFTFAFTTVSSVCFCVQSSDRVIHIPRNRGSIKLTITLIFVGNLFSSVKLRVAVVVLGFVLSLF